MGSSEVAKVIGAKARHMLLRGGGTPDLFPVQNFENQYISGFQKKRLFFGYGYFCGLRLYWTFNGLFLNSTTGTSAL